MRNAHCMIWNEARNIKNLEKGETYTVGTGIWQEIVKNKKYTLQDLDYGEKT